MRRAKRWLAVALAAGLAGSTPRAHDGPPFPIAVDEDLSQARLSIWADPDVGTGTFYFYVDPLPDGGGLDPLATALRVAVRPADGHVPEAVFESEPAPVGQPYQRVAEVAFDRRGPWHARFLAEAPEGRDELALEIDVTPPGAGRIDLVWFLSPFLAVAFLWVKVVLKKRELRRQDA